MIVNNISWWVVNASDRIMIEHYASAAELGLYTDITTPSVIIGEIKFENSILLESDEIQLTIDISI